MLVMVVKPKSPIRDLLLVTSGFALGYIYHLAMSYQRSLEKETVKTKPAVEDKKKNKPAPEEKKA